MTVDAGNEAARRAFGETVAPPPPPLDAAPRGSYTTSPPAREYSGWWRRVGALLLDNLIMTLVVMGVSFVVGLVLALSDTNFDTDGTAFTAVVWLLAIAANCLYAPLLMARRGEHNGQTFGKQALGIRVVRTTDEPVTFGNGALRTIVGQHLLALVTFSIWSLFDYLWPLGNERRESLHDKIAKTWVVRTQAQDTWSAPESASPWLPPQAPGA